MTSKDIRNTLNILKENRFDGKIIKKSVLAKLLLDGKDWCLFTATDPVGCEKAAKILNSAFVDAVDERLNKDEVRRTMYRVMQKLAKEGANDSEPRQVLEDLLDTVFPEYDGF